MKTVKTISKFLLLAVFVLWGCWIFLCLVGETEAREGQSIASAMYEFIMLKVNAIMHLIVLVIAYSYSSTKNLLPKIKL